MSSKLQFGALVSIAMLVASAVSACGSSGGNGTGNSTSSVTMSSSASGSASGVLNIGLDASPATLDPMLSSAQVDRDVMINIYDTLFALTPQGKIVPDLVSSYSISKDGLTYTFNLHKNIKFTDGTPFNAAAVKFNLERDLGPSSARRSELSAIKSIDTVGQYTVVLHLSEPYSPLLGVLTDRAGMMVSPAAVKKEGSNYATAPVGTGPFEFKSEVTGSSIDLVANKNYWKGAPKLQGVDFKIFTDPNVELTNLESGQVQLIDTVPAQQLRSLESNSNFTVSNKPGLGYEGIYLNVKQAPFTNIYLRQAIDAAINRQTLVNVVFRGEASPGWGPFSPVSPVYNAAQGVPPTPNAAKVKQLLKAGGQPNGFSFTLQVANSPVSVEMAQVIQSMLKQYNINMKIQQLDFDTLLSNNTSHSFQAQQLGWSGRIDPDGNVYSFWYTGAPDNASSFSDPLVDKLLNQARSESSMSARKQTYEQFMNELHKQDPYIFLYFQNNTYAYSNQLHGFQSYPDGVFRVYPMSLS